jgi:isopentenyl-diphosphate Delta-isomerase
MIVDYCVVVQRDKVRVEPNPNEARDIRWVSKEQLRELLDTATATNTLVTPWFKLICNEFLFKWWDSLADLSAYKDPNTIHKLA